MENNDKIYYRTLNGEKYIEPVWTTTRGLNLIISGTAGVLAKLQAEDETELSTWLTELEVIHEEVTSQ